VHSYGKSFNHSHYVHLSIALLAFGAYSALTALKTPGFIQHAIPSFFSIFALFEVIFDRWAWRLLTFLPFTKIVSFSGTFRGEVRPGAAGDEPLKVTLTIRQTWSKIVVDFQADPHAATAHSFSASITSDRVKDGQAELIYNYQAEGKNPDDGVRFNHYGTAMLKLHDGGSRLAGDYFTEQSRNSFGTIVAEKQTKVSE